MGCQMDSKQYTYRVKWSAEDNGYVGLCAEFPSLSWHDADQSKAFSGIEKLVADVVADMISNNEKVLTPLSGKI
ncbi:antitoxin HicB [Acinetobacter guillouiae]|uniref:antitoxin HicB n=1 Tax=Acinetobacter guillouiae TaxID=106649 RepID=UPI003AF5643E